MRKIGVVVAVLALAVVLAGPVLAQGKPQTACPVLGGNLDKNVYVDYQGYRIYFCCPGCDVEFKKDPEKYMKKLQEQGVTPEKSPSGAAKGGK